jgi:hypothetical protein
MLDTAGLTSLQRSTAMLPPGQQMPVDRDLLFELCSEVLEARTLLARLGTDLRAVAAKAPRTG